MQSPAAKMPGMLVRMCLSTAKWGPSISTPDHQVGGGDALPVDEDAVHVQPVLAQLHVHPIVLAEEAVRPSTGDDAHSFGKMVLTLVEGQIREGDVEVVGQRRSLLFALRGVADVRHLPARSTGDRRSSRSS